jgi:hypothetical protein
MVTGLPAEAQWRGVNEKKWGDSIQSDIRNGAPPDSICINAKSSATTSDEVPFKDWAYSIARKYCDADKLGKPDSTTQVVQDSGDCGLKIHHMYDISQGKHVVVKKGDCSMKFNH